VIEKGGGGIGFQLDNSEEDSSYNRIKSLVNEELKQYFRLVVAGSAAPAVEMQGGMQNCWLAQMKSSCAPALTCCDCHYCVCIF
jgi:hypothetical protein